MKITRTVILAATSILAASCISSDRYTGLPADDRIALTTSILSTRIQSGPDGKGNFTAGDRITLNASADSPSGRITREMTLTDQGWTPALRWSEINLPETRLAAYYPVTGTESQNGTFIHETATDQSDAEDVRHSDLLFATRLLSGDERTASLSFSHLMSRISVRLSSDGSYSDEELADARITLKAENRITVDIMTGTMEPAGKSQADIIMHRQGNRVFTAIVCPQPVHETWKTTGWMEITVAGKTFTYKAPDKLSDNSPFTELQSGRQVTLNITVKKKAEETDWTNKTGWIYGINNPPLEEWGYVSTTPYVAKGLKWDRSYGWYDCNKRFPNSGPGDNDSNLCWAAATSNILYWWLDQNKTYIDRYGKYAGPRNYANSLDCEIFDLFKRNFPNTGNDVAAAMSWFLTGKYGIQDKDGAGFFREVFGPVHVARITRFSERSFPEELKKTFSEKAAIECTFRYPNNTLIHAITLWGAEFDSTGDVTAIYITENNDRDAAEQTEYIDYMGRQITRAGMLRKEVRKKGDGYYYMESSVPGNFTFRIEELNILGLMEKEWEAYFSRQK